MSSIIILKNFKLIIYNVISYVSDNRVIFFKIFLK